MRDKKFVSFLDGNCWSVRHERIPIPIIVIKRINCILFIFVAFDRFPVIVILFDNGFLYSFCGDPPENGIWTDKSYGARLCFSSIEPFLWKTKMESDEFYVITTVVRDNFTLIALTYDVTALSSEEFLPASLLSNCSDIRALVSSPPAAGIFWRNHIPCKSVKFSTNVRVA